MLVIYEGLKEIFITSLEDEKLMLIEYFAEHTGRDIEDYERTEAENVRIEAKINIHA